MQLDWPVRLHLIVGTTLVLGSWIGFRRSLNRPRYQVKFFNLPFLGFLLDQLMLILYFRVAVLTPTPISGNTLGADDLAKKTSVLILLIFILYAFWDLVGMLMAWSKISNEDGSKKPRYPVVEKPGKAQDVNWPGFGITLSGTVIMLALWLARDCFTPNEILVTIIVLLLLYRWAKEIRTSCKSLRQA